MKKLFPLIILTLIACGTTPPQENLNERQELIKTRLYSAFITPEIKELPVVVISGAEMLQRFNVPGSYTDFDVIYIADDTDFCLSLASEFYDIEMKRQPQFNNDPLGQFMFKLSYLCS